MEIIFYYGEQISEGNVVKLGKHNEKSYYGVVLKGLKVAFYDYDNDKNEFFNLMDLGKSGCRFETIQVVRGLNAMTRSGR